MEYPRISIVTPSFNQGTFLEQTILSIIKQRYPNLEFIVIDGGSSDDSVKIIKKFKEHIAYWISEPDRNMYDAIQKGFEKSTGKIMGWINSDDMLHPGSLFNIAEILSLKGVNWIQGYANGFDEQGRTVAVVGNGPWSQLRLVTDKKCIQQDCTFWRRELWDKAGGRVDTSLRLAGDFELWYRFFKYDRLFTPHCLTGGFRMRRSGQLSDNADEYYKEVALVLKDLEKNEMLQTKIEKLNSLKKWKRLLSKSRILNLFFIMNRLDNKIKELHDFPPAIDFCQRSQKFSVSSK